MTEGQVSTPPDRRLAAQDATNEPESPTERARLPIGTTVLALLALLVGLGLTAVPAAAAKTVAASPPSLEQDGVTKAQVLLLNGLGSTDRPSLPAMISGRPASD